jgi:glucose uptake protein GlcU
MLDDQFLIVAGLIVTVMLIIGFLFTAYEFSQLEEEDDKHYKKDDVADVTFNDEK